MLVKAVRIGAAALAWSTAVFAQGPPGPEAAFKDSVSM